VFKTTTIKFSCTTTERPRRSFCGTSGWK